MDVWTQSGHMSVVESVVGIHVFAIQFLKLLSVWKFSYESVGEEMSNQEPGRRGNNS